MFNNNIISSCRAIPEKDLTSEFLAREREEQLKRETVTKTTTETAEQSDKLQSAAETSDQATFVFTKEIETTYAIHRTDEPSIVKEIKSVTTDIPSTHVVENIETRTEITSRGAGKFDVSKIRTDTLGHFSAGEQSPDDVKDKTKGKFVPKILDLKETPEITKEQVKPVIDEILHKGTIAAAARSPVCDKDIKISTIETEKRSYDAKAPHIEERRHSCISPAISLERIAESEAESDEEEPRPSPKPINIPKHEMPAEMKKSDSAMKQMADNIEIIIKQASEDFDVSGEESIPIPTEAQERQDIADNVSVDSIIEEAVTTVEGYLEKSSDTKEKEIEVKKEIVYEETKKFVKERPALMKSLSRDSGEIVIMPKKKHPRTFSVQSSPEEVEEQIYTDSESGK